MPERLPAKEAWWVWDQGLVWFLHMLFSFFIIIWLLFFSAIPQNMVIHYEDQTVEQQNKLIQCRPHNLDLHIINKKIHELITVLWTDVFTLIFMLPPSLICQHTVKTHLHLVLLEISLSLFSHFFVSSFLPAQTSSSGNDVLWRRVCLNDKAHFWS